MVTGRFHAIRAAAVGAGLLVLAGCHSPLERTEDEMLREQLLGTQRFYREAVAGSPTIQITRPPSITEQDLDPRFREENDRSAGPEAYRSKAPNLGPDLTGRTDAPVVGMTLQRAVALAARHSLDVQLAAMGPAITETQIVQAEAIFDATFFATLNRQSLDQPRSSFVGPLQTTTNTLSTGIRKPLTTGGQMTLQGDFTETRLDPASLPPPRFFTADVLLSLQQPLLRNFGADLTRSQIELAQNARGQAVQDVRTRMLEVLATTEAAYWQLVFARQRLLIAQQLQARAERDRELIKLRLPVDAQPAQLTEASSFVELRRADVIRARQDVRSTSDALKRLLNAPDLPIASEVVIEPLEIPADVPVQLNLLDAVTTALQHRPELKRALLEIKDATIRQRVADNQRLPQLDVVATMRMNGQDPNTQMGAIGEIDGRFVDYILGLQFEVPIGNRAAEAAFRQRQLERRATVLAYQRAAQAVVNEVKDAMRALQTAYELIGATRAARRAATENLRVLQVKEEAGERLSPEFIDQKLRSQERLANAESQEAQALSDYNTAIARFYQALGTLMERDGIELKDDWQPRRSDEAYAEKGIWEPGTSPGLLRKGLGIEGNKK